VISIFLELLWIGIIIVVHESSHYLLTFIFGGKPEFTLSKWGPAVQINNKISLYQYLTILLIPFIPTAIFSIAFQVWFFGLWTLPWTAYVVFGLIFSLAMSSVDIWYSLVAIYYGFKARKMGVPLIIIPEGGNHG